MGGYAEIKACPRNESKVSGMYGGSKRFNWERPIRMRECRAQVRRRCVTEDGCVRGDCRDKREVPLTPRPQNKW